MTIEGDSFDYTNTGSGDAVCEDNFMQEDAFTETDEDAYADALIVGASGLSCEEFDPEDAEAMAALGIQQDVLDNVRTVINGNGCPIYIDPEIKDSGCINQINDLLGESAVTFDGTMFVLSKGGGYNMGKDSEMLIEAFSGACSTFPDVTIKAIGIEIKPEAGIPSEISVETGLSMARIHVWKGGGKVFSIDAKQYVEIATGMQIVTNGDFSTFEATQIGNPEEGNKDSDTSDRGDEYNPEAQTMVPENFNCSFSNKPMQGVEGIYAFIMALLIGKAVKSRLGNVFGLKTIASAVGLNPTDTIDAPKVEVRRQISGGINGSHHAIGNGHKIKVKRVRNNKPKPKRKKARRPKRK